MKVDILIIGMHSYDGNFVAACQGLQFIWDIWPCAQDSEAEGLVLNHRGPTYSADLSC